MSFYAALLKDLVRRGRLDPAAPTLVVAGDSADRDALHAAGFTAVTISNLDARAGNDGLAPYAWRRLDAEALDLADGAFAQVIEHMGLHHCRSPHRALAEMVRVASGAVLAIENRDSATMRLAGRLGLAGDYELDAVRDGGYAAGGMRNGGTPNHVYRWTEREVAKTVASLEPAYVTPIEYFYDLRFPEQRVARMRGWRRAAAEAARLPLAGLARIAPRQANVFGFLIDKRARRLQPWMAPDGAAMAHGEQRA
jgi:hypothetical protein